MADDQNSLTSGERGPVLRQDVQLLEKLSHLDREHLPERVVRATSAGRGYWDFLSLTPESIQYGA